MLKLIHAPMSRSSRILWLIEEMGIGDKVQIEPVGIRRFDGSGQRDPANPHPEGKVPALIHDRTLITESGADRKSTRLNSSHGKLSRMPSSA